MTKRLFIFTAVLPIAATALLGQNPVSSFQQPGWVTAPGSSLIPAHTFATEAQAGPVINKPVSGTESRHTTQTLADGTHVDDSSTSGFYRDSQGRMRSESTTKVLIYDPVAGFIFSLDTRTKVAHKDPLHNAASKVSIAAIGNRTSVSTSSTSSTTTGNVTHRTSNDPISVGKAAQRVQMSRVQTSTEELPPQMVNGVFCHGSRVTETIPAGTFGNDRDVKVVSERWYSDDLQLLVKTSNSDPRFGVTTYEFLNASQASPDPALFQVPSDYTVQQTQMFEVGHGVPGVPHVVHP